MLVRQDVRVRVGLEQLNSSRHLIQLVIDGDGALVGTMTDGDVRRGLLRGLGLEATVAQFMNGNPRTARDVREAVVALAELNAQRPCVPVLDEMRRPVALVVRTGGDEASCRRLRELRAVSTRPLRSRFLVQV